MPALELRVGFALVYVLTATVGLMGNLFVVYVICSNKKFRSCAMNVILVNLAIADLLNIVSCLPDIAHSLLLIPWPFGHIFCSGVRYAQSFSVLTSVYLQVTVCLERFIAICYPMLSRVHQSWRKVTAALVIAWTSSLIFAIPYIPINVLRNGTCMPENHSWLFTYMTAELIVFYFIPGIMFIAIYSVISTTLWKASQTLRTGDEEQNKEQRAITRKCRKDRSEQDSIIHKRKKVIKTLVACVMTYLICYSPTNFLFVYQQVNLEFRIEYDLSMFFNWLTYLSAAANPVIYVMCMPVFRRYLLNCFGSVTKSAAEGAELYTHNPKISTRSFGDSWDTDSRAKRHLLDANTNIIS